MVYFQGILLMLRGCGALLRNFLTGSRSHKCKLATAELIQSLCRDEQVARFSRQDPLSMLDYTFDQPLVGKGWFPRETANDIFWRFTGPEGRATIMFPRLAKGLEKVRITVFHTVTLEHLASLRMTVNGKMLERAPDMDGFVEFILPEDIFLDPFAELLIQTLPGVSPGERDDRKVGVAFSRIEIF